MKSAVRIVRIEITKIEKEGRCENKYSDGK